MPAAIPPVPERDALYYPRIHIRDANWLKAALLCFPQVRRMAPYGYLLNDEPSVQPFTEKAGHRRELLAVEYTDPGVTGYAQSRLLKVFERHPSTLRARYTRERAAAYTKGRPDDYQIHGGKANQVLEALEQLGLAWRPRVADPEWFAVHPIVGETIMSCVAIAIARAKGLDIVTDQRHVHRALADQDEKAIIANLVGDSEDGDADPPLEETSAEDLAQLTIALHFNVSSLTASDIRDIVGDGGGLRLFKQRVAEVAATIPPMSDPGEREKRLRYAAAEIIHEWSSFRKSLGKTIVDAVFTASEIKKTETIIELLGLVGVSTLAAGVGGFVFATAYSGVKIYRSFSERSTDPRQFLSRLSRKAPFIEIGGPLMPMSLRMS